MTERLDTLLRYERGELPLAEAAALRQALRDDEEARAWLDWIVALRGARDALVGPEGGAPPEPIEIAALAEGSLSPERAREVRAALARSGEGYALFEAAVAEARELAREAAAHPRRAAAAPRPRPWLAAAATAASLAALVAVLVLLGDGRGSPAELARVEPMAAAALRGPEGALARGLAAYRAGAWEPAADELGRAAEADPGLGEAWLYLGSARLLQGRHDEAAAALERAVDAASGSFAEEARWQLAQARLLAERADDAAALLRALAAGSGHRSADARAQLAALDAPPR